jgi:K+-sensing histidine kinase KdpD
VITTVSIGHLDSLADVAENITGVPAGGPCPTRSFLPRTRSSW